MPAFQVRDGAKNRDTASERRPKRERRDAEGDVNANRTLERDWLQRKRASRAADQDVGANSKTEADVA